MDLLALASLVLYLSAWGWLPAVGVVGVLVALLAVIEARRSRASGAVVSRRERVAIGFLWSASAVACAGLGMEVWLYFALQHPESDMAGVLLLPGPLYLVCAVAILLVGLALARKSR